LTRILTNKVHQYRHIYV